MTQRWVRIVLATQQLELLEDERVTRIYPVSTSRLGAGEREGSEQTPRGEHAVRELIGHGAPSGAVFSARRQTGEICSSAARTAEPLRDWILSRIVWLEGLEPGVNCGGNVDSYARYIYIHGTPDDEPMTCSRWERASGSRSERASDAGVARVDARGLVQRRGRLALVTPCRERVGAGPGDVSGLEVPDGDVQVSRRLPELARCAREQLDHTCLVGSHRHSLLVLRAAARSRERHTCSVFQRGCT